MPITLRDVARSAGVSIKTVSRVVNHQGEISEETRQRILAVIREMGYRPNMVARGLVTQRTRTIGLVVPDITNPFFPEVARGVQDLGKQHHYNVFLCNSGEDQQEELNALYSLAGQGVDGIIIAPCYLTNNNLKVFAEQYRPIVAFNYLYEHPNIGVVLTNNYQGARIAVDYLVGKGHRQIGMVAGLESSPVRGRRVRGFRDGVAAAGLGLKTEYLRSAIPTFEHGYVAALDLLSQNPELTALFTYNDLMALGAIQACQTLGRRVPEDCAIVGFDDIQMAKLAHPPLTTIRLEKYKVGEQTVKRLLEMLENPQAIFAPIELDVELIVRQSA